MLDTLVASQKHETTETLLELIQMGSIIAHVYLCGHELHHKMILGRSKRTVGSVSRHEEAILGLLPLVLLEECQRSGKDRYDLEESTWLHS